MDWNGVSGRFTVLAKKYRYVLLIFCVGILMMCMPESNEPDRQIAVRQTESSSVSDLAQSLSVLLSQIEGAGKVQVLLAESVGERIWYQTDADRTASEKEQDIREETVIITEADRTQHGLIQKVDQPIYRGAVVVCQGADNAMVRLSIVSAVCNATGLTSDRITVVKMK